MLFVLALLVLVLLGIAAVHRGEPFSKGDHRLQEALIQLHPLQDSVIPLPTVKVLDCNHRLTVPRLQRGPKLLLGLQLLGHQRLMDRLQGEL